MPALLCLFFSLQLFCCCGSNWQFCLFAPLKAILVASWHLTILEMKEGRLGWENEGNFYFKEREEKGICAQISSCPAFLLHLSVSPFRARWVQGVLCSNLCHLFHAPGYSPAFLGFQEVLQGYLQGRCQVKLPAQSSSGRMEQCKEPLLLSFLVFA